MSVPIGHFVVSVRQWLGVTQVLSCASWDAWATLRCSWGRVLVLHRCCCKCSIVQEGKNKKKGEKKKKKTHTQVFCQEAAVSSAECEFGQGGAECCSSQGTLLLGSGCESPRRGRGSRALAVPAAAGDASLAGSKCLAQLSSRMQR